MDGICLGFGFVNENDRRFLVDMPEGVAVPLKETILIHYGYLVKRNRRLSETMANLAQYLRIFFNQ